MAAFFNGENVMREPSSDLFMMNLNPFTVPTTTTIAHNHDFYNMCFGSQKVPLEVLSKDQVEGNSSISSTVSNEGVTQSFKTCAPTYLRAAQELLNEIVYVGNCTKLEQPMNKEPVVYGLYNGVGDINGGYKSSMACNRQELEMKKSKLISLVEKDEERYKQYHNQMQTTISSFEQATSLGSANTYTHLALETISKKFRAVKDMICLQIKHINKLLGEKECEGVSLADEKQLKRCEKISHNYSNGWRQQRGLPETAVFILRTWLFQHFLHPYPRDMDKEMLAKQTGLTKSQVSNWFINARVRVWKPMVEELYLEEMNIEKSRKESNYLNENSNKGSSSSSKQNYNNTTSNESTNLVLPTFPQGFIANQVPMQNSSSSCSVATFRKQQVNQANLIHFNGGFENYHAMVRNGVSLSLGLPYSCDQHFNNIQFGSTSHGTEISGIYPSSTYQIMD